MEACTRPRTFLRYVSTLLPTDVKLSGEIFWQTTDNDFGLWTVHRNGRTIIERGGVLEYGEEFVAADDPE